MSFFRFKLSGQSLVELLVIVGLAAIFLPALLTGLVAARDGKAQERQRVQASAYLQEAQEAVRSVREKGWDTFAVNGTFHPVASSSTWVLVANAETINGFTRQIVVSDVNRDSTGVIVTAPNGTTDPSTKKVVVTVSWTQPYSSNVSSTMYLTRHDNLAHPETLAADFNPGTKTNTYVTNTSGGEVILGAGGGGGDWCNPSFAITTVDLSRQGVPTAVAAFPGNVVTGTGGNASGPTFVKTSLAGNSPPATTFVGQYNNSKANAVATETNYGYIATTNHSQEIQILDMTQYSDVTNKVFSLVGWFDAPGNGNGNSVFASGTTGYMTSGSSFYTFDLTSHTGSRPQLNTTSVTLAGTGTKIVVVNNYAFISVSSSTTQMQIVNVTDPTKPSIVASFGTGNGQAGVDVAVNSTGTRAYLVTSYASSTQPDFFVVDTTTKSGSLSKIGTGFNTNGMSPKGVAVTTGNRAIIVGTGGTTQYQVVSISNESSPTSCAGLAVTNGAYAVSTVLQSDGYAYAYVATGDTAHELKIILGGAGGQYVTSGTFESATFDPTFTTAFNRIVATVSQPSQTSIKLQVAVAKPVNNSCTGVSFTTYLGPDGTSGSYFTTSTDPTTIDGQIPLVTTGSYANPGRCFRYKAWLTTNDSTQTPEIDDVTVNYSP